MITPLAPPPPGVQSDFQDLGWGPAITDMCIVLLVFNTIFTAGRVYTRVVALKAFGWDDTFCVLAWMSISVQIAFNFVAIHYGFGRHIWNIPASNTRGLFKTFFVLQIQSLFVYMFLKLAFLVTYLRIFNPSQLMRFLIWGGIVVVVTFHIADGLYGVFKCDPIAKSWDPLIKGKCVEEFVPGAPTGIFNVISDLYILFLPTPMVVNAFGSWRRKVKLFSIFSIGVFTVVTSVIRLAETLKQAHNPDSTYTVGRVDIWANLEYSVGQIALCILVLPALWNRSLRDPLTTYWSRASSVILSLRTTRSGSESAAGHESDETRTIHVVGKAESTG